MITVNSISGGKTSAYLAKHYPAAYNIFSLVCIDDTDCKPKDASIIHYVNAKLEKFIPEYGEFIATAEDPQTLYVMRDLEQYLGVEITWVRGMCYDDVIDKGTQTRLPSWARRYCTEKMKLLPIFMWWFNNIGEKVSMRIGFRADEFDRMLRFFNNSDPTEFSIPVSCSTKGQRLQRHQTFNWRYCDMPLVRDGIDKSDVANYWKGKKTPSTLFEEPKDIIFPKISNCCTCFHKNIETLIYEAIINRNIMKWGAKQEYKKKGETHMGTWRDDRMTFDEIIAKADAMTDEEVEFLIQKIEKVDGNYCDVGGCTD